MKTKRIEIDPSERLEIADRKLLAELEEMVEDLPPHLFGDIVGTGSSTGPFVIRGRSDEALPFLILVDTRIN